LAAGFRHTGDRTSAHDAPARDHAAMDILTDLVAEQERLEGILATLDDSQWLTPSLCEGWTVADVVLHLAQTEESVVASGAAGDATTWREGPDTVDEMMETLVQEQRAAPAEVFERWKAARRAAVETLRSADPNSRLRWAAAPLKPATLATTRLAEHWAHALDIVEPLQIDFPDTERLRHIAWLGHSTLPYAFGLAGHDPAPIRCELTGPSGDPWTFGPADAASRIVGAAGEFCRVGAHRLAAAESHLIATGPDADTALKVLRNYAF